MSLKILIVILTGLVGSAIYFILISQPTLSPSPDELVEDTAHLFTVDSINYIDEYHAMLLDKFDLDYRIVTLNGQHDINSYAAKIFNDRNIGEKSKNHRGLLLIIDAKNDQVRLEVSANLESVYTDAFVAYLENRQMVPFFKVGRVADGIFATAEIIRIRAMDAEKGEEFDMSAITGSLGGGARTKADIGAGKDHAFQDGKADVIASDDPQETLRRYISALTNRNGRNDLDVFTAETRTFMGTMLSTPAQMDSAVKRLKNCEVEHITYNPEHTRAVLFHSLKHRECDPFLFEIGDDGKWRLDFKALGLGTNHTFGNIWYVHYGRQEESGFWKYDFGFKHVFFHRPEGENGRFDHQGIPYYHSFGLDYNHIAGNMLITHVQKNSFMDKIGLRAGDELVEWEGKRFLYTTALSQRLERVRPGLDIRIVVRRDNKIISQFVKAPSYPKENHYRFGFSYQSTLHTKNPIVHYVEPNSQAEILGLKEGDLIHKWQDIESPNAGEIYSAIKAQKNNDPVYVEVLRDGDVVTLKSIAQPLREMGKVQ